MDSHSHLSILDFESGWITKEERKCLILAQEGGKNELEMSVQTSFSYSAFMFMFSLSVCLY